MKSLKNRFLDLIPAYSHIPICVALILNTFIFYATRPMAENLHHHNLTTDLDLAIPFVPEFILIYIFAAYSLWAVGFVIIARENEDFCYHYYSSEMIGELIIGLIFVLFPTIMVRADITGDGVCEELTRLIYAVDRPDNLFPSIHCYESWIVMRGILKAKRVYKPIKIIAVILTVSICISVVFVKQHVVVDIISGIALAELSLLLGKVLKTKNIFYFSRAKILKLKKTDR